MPTFQTVLDPSARYTMNFLGLSFSTMGHSRRKDKLQSLTSAAFRYMPHPIRKALDVL